MTTLILPTEMHDADIFTGTINRAPVTNKTLVMMLAAAKAATRHCQRRLRLAPMTLTAPSSIPFGPTADSNG